MNYEDNIVIISTQRFEELIQAQTALNFVKVVLNREQMDYRTVEDIKALMDAIDPGWRQTNKEGTDAE